MKTLVALILLFSASAYGETFAEQQARMEKVMRGESQKKSNLESDMKLFHPVKLEKNQFLPFCIVDVKTTGETHCNFKTAAQCLKAIPAAKRIKGVPASYDGYKCAEYSGGAQLRIISSN